MKADALRGHLDALILAVVESEPLHGYAIIEALQVRSGGRDRPADRHRLPRTAPARVGRLPHQRLVRGRRSPAAYLQAVVGGTEGARPPARGVAHVRHGDERRAAADVTVTRSGESPMRTDPKVATMAPMGVAGYLAELDAALVGPRRVRRDLVREAGDHLEDATDAYRRAGRDSSEAERLAVRDFGTLDEIAPAFQTTLAVAASRRTAWLLLGDPVDPAVPLGRRAGHRGHAAARWAVLRRARHVRRGGRRRS